MRKVILDQYIPCKSFQIARAISAAFSGFRIKKRYLGSTQNIKASRFIRKSSSKTHSHYVVIRYSIPYDGEFTAYGFIDEKSIIRHSELPSIIASANSEDRWDIILEYERSEDEWNDIVFYQNFDEFFKNELVNLLNRIDIACKVSFSCKLHTDFFQIYYEECGQAYERGFIANSNASGGLSIATMSDITGMVFAPIPLQSIWDWSEEYFYDKKSRWYSAAKAWNALSYVFNRESYESLLYAIMGLEAVYTQGDKQIKSQLRQAVPKVVRFISPDEINELYKLRSEFVHGDIAFPTFGVKNWDTSQWELTPKAAAVLLETVRLLVQNRATKIHVEKDDIVFKCDRTLRGDLQSQDKESIIST